MSSSAGLLLIFAVACSSLLLASSRKMNIDREALIESAVAEVKLEFSTAQKAKLSGAQLKLQAFKKATPEALAQGLASLKFERMVKLAENKILKSQRQASVQTTSSMAEALAMELLHKPGTILSKQEIARMYQESNCINTLPTPANCDTPAAMSRRTADGSCNNLDNPTFGAAGTPMRRLLSARYDDGISRARGYLQSQRSPLFSNGPFGAPYPSARVASIEVVRDREVNDTQNTHILMQWAQFMDHDMDVVPQSEGNCPAGCEVPSDLEGICYPIPVPEDDDEILVTRADSSNTRCHGFLRSLGVCPTGELVDTLPPREHLNLITHFIDGSMVYGHSDAILNDLRDSGSNDGLLRTGSSAAGRPLLPDADSNSFVLCPPGVECFVAGDLRVNEQPALVVMHTIWIREHNRIARSLRSNNPSLTSDQIFFTARDIVISEIQKITYKDFLPIIVGDSLIPSYNRYDNTVNPNIPNSFAAAAYRFGHSQIQPFFERLGENYESIPAGPLPLVEAFFNTGVIRESGTDLILRGLLAKPARQVDEFITSVLTNQLFANDAGSPGLDLAAINIQRGRDHGLPTYLTWKQWAEDQCGVESGFRHELTEIRLLQTYGSLDSVDLFVGGLAEEPLPGGVVGATFGCIFANAFIAVRDGDRFYYENSDPATALLTEDQRSEISKTSLSRVICDNTDIDEIQENAFLANQARVSCSEIPSVNLDTWTGSGPSTPEQCYIKVSSRMGGRYIVLSRTNPSSRFDFNDEVIRSNGDFCFPLECPQSDQESTFTVLSRQQPRCAPQLNPNLPSSSRSRVRSSYSQRLSIEEITRAENGLYTSLGSCEAESSPSALNYVCTERFVSTEEDADHSVHIMTNSIDEVKKLAAGNEDLIDQVFGSSSSSSSSSNEEKLVGLMEEMLKELKSSKVSSHEETVKQEEKTAEDESNSSLLSELEEALQKLE